MPEGHLLHRLARDHQQLVGRVLAATSPQGRFADGAAAVDGRRLTGVEAWGKHLLHRFGPDAVVHSHLGMQGSWFRSAPARPPVRQVRLRLATDDVAWDLVAPSRCELLDGAAARTLLAGLGPDPLRPDADPEEAWARLHARRGPLGVALLDQSVIAGIGNVFRAEALAACGLHPSLPAAALRREGFDRLWATVGAMMRRAVDEGRIVTVAPDAPADVRAALPEAEARYVYQQERCRRCGTPVDAWDLSGRTAYACPACQPAPRGEEAPAGPQGRTA